MKFTDLDRLKAEADEREPLKPGMFRFNGKIYTREGDEAWDRATEKWCSPLTADDLIRFERIKKRWISK
jgi:hypothetical protein